MSNHASKTTKKHAYRWLSSLSAHCRRWLYCSVFLGVLNGILIIAQAFLLASIIYQAAVHHATRASLIFSMSLLLSVVIVRALMSWLREIVNLKSAVAVKTSLRQQLLEHIMAVGPVRLSRYQGGALGNALVEQVEAVHDFFAHYLPQMYIVTILPVLILMMVFPKSWMAGLVLLVTAPLIPLFMAFVGMGAESRSQQQFEQMSKMSGYFLDVLRGLMTLKLFKASLATIKKITAISDEYRKKTMSVLRIAFLSSAVLELFSSVAIAILAVYLGLGLLGLVHVGLPKEIISLQSALFILLLAPEFFLPLRQLGVHYHAKAQAVGAAEEIQKLLESTTVANDMNTETTEIVKKRYYCDQATQIIFDDVSYSYNDNAPILNHFNLSIAPNQHTVIVGQSGSGKSTILNLINGFIAPNSGCIRINGEDLQTFNVDSWRQQIAWVGQNTRLFYGTIRENLLMAKPSATDQELMAALQVAYLDDLIRKLPKGLATVIGEQNRGLSYGQIQRIALCRAYLKNAPILLLDEATANLDHHSEKVILEAIKSMSRYKTVVSVTHRQQTMLIADTVVDLNKTVTTV